MKKETLAEELMLQKEVIEFLRCLHHLSLLQSVMNGSEQR